MRHFDRPAVALDVALREAELLAGRHADHPFDEVEPGDHLRHGCSTCSRVFISEK
jgi:hypothetical protein